MADWKDDKDRGPWPFTPQYNKWAYLNNPRWQPVPRPFVPGGPDDYNGRESEEPQIWTPNRQPPYPSGTSKIHHQCGHWHKPIAGVSLFGPCVDPVGISPSLGTGLIFFGSLQVNPPEDLIDPPLEPDQYDPHYPQGYRVVTAPGSNFDTGDFSLYAPYYYATVATLGVDGVLVNTKLCTPSVTLAFWFYHLGMDIHAQKMITMGNIGSWGQGYWIGSYGYFWDLSYYIWHIDTASGPIEINYLMASGDPNSAPNLYTWHFMVYTYDASTGKSYVYSDGNIVGYQQVSPGAAIYQSHIHGGLPSGIAMGNIGGAAAQICNGYIPCVRIWDRALTQAEVVLLYSPLS